MQKKRRRFQVNKKIKISNSVRMILILLSIGVIAFGSGNLIKSINNRIKIKANNEELYKYNNKFTSDSKINLKDNKYVQENEMQEGQAYLSDLISDIDMNLNYEYIASKQSEIKYNYKIEAIVNSVYSNTKGSYDVLNKSEILKEGNNTETDSQKIKISEKVNVDYEKYHQMIKEFKQSMNLNTDSYLYIKLTVNVNTNIDSRDIEDKYVSNYKITLGDKVAVVEEKKDDEETNSIKRDAKDQEKIEPDYSGIILSIIMMLLGGILLRIILKRTEELKVIRNEFKLELNRIRKSYEDKIVEIQDINNIDIENATKVKDIMQLRKLAEEALVPIYCYVKEGEKEEAYFIVTKYDKSYIYILE